MFKINKVVALALSSILMISQGVVASAAESETSRYQYVSTSEVLINVSNVGTTKDTLKSGEVKTAKIHTFNDNGKKVYKVEIDGTPQEKIEAFKTLNNYMESGLSEETIVVVNEKNKEFYGNEWDTSKTNILGYSWAKYKVGSRYSGINDTTWGGSSASYTGTGSFGYIKLMQKTTVNATGASASLSISWPPSLDVSASRTSSTGTWESETEYNDTILGAEHELVELNYSDLHGATITSCIYVDTANVKVGATIYKPSTSVRFKSGL